MVRGEEGRGAVLAGSVGRGGPGHGEWLEGRQQEHVSIVLCVVPYLQQVCKVSTPLLCGARRICRVLPVGSGSPRAAGCGRGRSGLVLLAREGEMTREVQQIQQ